MLIAFISKTMEYETYFFGGDGVDIRSTEGTYYYKDGIFRCGDYCACSTSMEQEYESFNEISELDLIYDGRKGNSYDGKRELFTDVYNSYYLNEQIDALLFSPMLDFFEYCGYMGDIYCVSIHKVIYRYFNKLNKEIMNKLKEGGSIHDFIFN